MKWTYQHHRCCDFDSPGLPNDSAGYPGLEYGLRGTTPSVLRFFWLIRHEIFHYKRAFIEKAQHLRRWISLQTLTRGRLVPRQPRAIKRTTRTELRRCDIRNGKCIHWNNGAIPTALHHEGIFIIKYIHRNTGIKNTALRRCDIHNAKYIHWDTGAISTMTCTIASFVCKQIVCYGIAFLSTLLFNSWVMIKWFASKHAIKWCKACGNLTAIVRLFAWFW